MTAGTYQTGSLDIEGIAPNISVSAPVSFSPSADKPLTFSGGSSYNVGNTTGDNTALYILLAIAAFFLFGRK